jgi:protein phosphatase
VRLGRAAGRTDTGRRRRRNEDAYVVAPPFFAIADGMGGAQAGEIASRLAARALEEGADDDGGGAARVVELIQEANRRVYQRSSEDPSTSGMGTTMTVALVEGDTVSIGHVGDSRAYRIRDGELAQLTEDHTLVQELMRSGKLTPEEAETHPQRSVITRALGTDPDVDVDTFPVDARTGDVFMLCSDGLTTMVGDEAILRIVEENRGDLDAAAEALVSTANRGGGEDNITVVLFDIADEAAALDETARIPAAGERDDDEDTLSGLEPLPAVDTMVVPPEQVEQMFEPVPAEPEPEAGEDEDPDERMRRIGRNVLIGLGVVLVVGGAVAVAAWSLL